MKLKAMLALAIGLTTATAFAATDLVIATVNNGHMIEMQKHTADFEKANHRGIAKAVLHKHLQDRVECRR